MKQPFHSAFAALAIPAGLGAMLLFVGCDTRRPVDTTPVPPRDNPDQRRTQHDPIRPLPADAYDDPMLGWQDPPIYDQPIPAKYSEDGGNISPPLEWTGGPTGTTGYVVIVEDGGSPARWAMINPPSQ